jgi:epoxyqueuosine reductase
VPAVAPGDYGHFRRWLDLGHAGPLEYLHSQEAARAHPGSILEGVRSVVMVAQVYGHRAPEGEAGPTRGRVARYARGGDYHELLWRRLEALLGWLEGEAPGVRGRAVADSAPLLERDFARLAGLGWIGKNTLLLSRRLGSFTVLGALLIDLDLEPDAPAAVDHCGTCTRCLDACPTGAFVGPYELDARRCISTWTIEHRGPLPDESAANLHGWVFGCDICQEVCPWNRKAPEAREPALLPRPEWTDPDLIALLEADPEALRRALKGTALARAKRAGLVRNAAYVLGTRRVAAAVPALSRLRDDADPAVRAAAAWALARIEAGPVPVTRAGPNSGAPPAAPAAAPPGPPG